MRNILIKFKISFISLEDNFLSMGDDSEVQGCALALC